jgi:hypothetical protein
MSNLLEHAKRELELAGLYDQDSDYNGDSAKAVEELVEVFSKQGHSGGSAWLVTEIFCKLVKYENLTPITDNPDDWQDVSEYMGKSMWQSKRNPSIFSTNAGKSWERLS